MEKIIKIKIVVSFWLLVVASISSAQTKKEIDPNGYNKFYYDNGKISSEGPMENGKPNGYWKTYFENGKIKTEGNRKFFQLDSVWKFYNEDGILVLEYYYANGKKNGNKKVYNAKDKFLLSEQNYKNDTVQGLSTYFFKNGKIKAKVNYANSREEGMGYEYDSTGTVITITEYKSGFIKHREQMNHRDGNGWKQGLWKEFFDNGQVKTECNYLDDKPNGYCKEYALNGSLNNASKYQNGKMVENPPELAKLDVQNYYYDNGVVKSTGTYKNGIPEGTVKEFNQEGKPVDAKIYKDGILIGEGLLDSANKEQGPWKEFHSNGQLKSQGEYKNGKKIGDWKFFHPNGKSEQAGKYDKKGRAQGQWKWYYESGNLLREENYLNNKQDGSMTEYEDSTHKIITKGEYLDGQQEGMWVYEITDYKEVGKYKSDRRDSVWKHFYIPSNKLKFIGNYIDGNPDGKHIYYYPNGEVQIEGKYIAGSKDGDWKYFDELGVQYLMITYKDDVEIKYDGIRIKLFEKGWPDGKPLEK